jgi:agmatinase
VALIQLDSHSDTWDQYWGSKYSHGTPVRRAVEEDLLREGYILQIGLRGQLYGEDDLAFVRDHKLRMVTTEELLAKGLAPLRRLFRRFHG